ncbi:MAG: DNA adenine methylase [Planctomycetota bacterium]
MFYYYGRKKQIVRHYPPPNYDVIIEPFAGAAAYAFHHNAQVKRVILVEKDEKVSRIWKWLINEATVQDIQSLPDLQPGERSTEFLHIIHAATKMAFAFKKIKVTPVLARNWEISKRVFARHLNEIKHWEIICGDYKEAPDIEATWFIDPPYRGEPGMGYRHSSSLIDYRALANWALSRKGEIICCEGDGADYLPFIPLLDLKGVAGKVSKEMIFYRPGNKMRQPYLFDVYAQQENQPDG